MRLALNCVGGKETAEMAKLLAMDGKLGELLCVLPTAVLAGRAIHTEAHQLFTVTYGGMAKTALALPPSLFIFRKLTSCVVSWLFTCSLRRRQDIFPRMAITNERNPSSRTTVSASGSRTGSRRTPKSDKQ